MGRTKPTATEGDLAVVRRFRIEGQVQGVGFRSWTRSVATELQVRGRVRNLIDGAVEVLAEGAPARLEALEGALRDGPSTAYVRSLTVQEVADEEGGWADFRIDRA